MIDVSSLHTLTFRAGAREVAPYAMAFAAMFAASLARAARRQRA
jgi:hypothetical protein